MKGASSKDLMIILVLAIITTIFTSTALFRNYTLDIVLFILIFIGSGYALISVLYPEENFQGLLRKPILIMEMSVFLTILTSVILKYSPLGLQLRDLILILSLITLLLAVTSYILRRSYLKPDLKETPVSEQVAEKSIQKTFQPSKEVTEPSKEITLPFKAVLPKNIIIFTLLSLLMLITVLIPPLNKTPIWMVPGSLFILFIPGYLLLAVMFPKNDDLELVERFGLGCGGSLILTSLIGLAFNYTPWSIRLELILIVLAVFSLIFCFISFMKLKKVPRERRLHILKLEKVLSIFLIICILLTVATSVYIFLSPESLNTGHSTGFYVSGVELNNSNYALNLTSGEKTNLTMVLENHEGSTMNYQVVVMVNNLTLKQSNVTLENNQRMEIPLNFTPGVTGKRNMEFIIYKLPDENPYQKWNLGMNVI
ncbi:MAG: DUF1616 domain-containing protein [Methanobacterium sp.]|nr:DUF1616 domain-containing protein [Methanobacterium sp.]